MNSSDYWIEIRQNIITSPPKFLDKTPLKFGPYYIYLTTEVDISKKMQCYGITVPISQCN